MKKEQKPSLPLNEIQGKKLRRQFFTFFVLLPYFLMLYVPYCGLVFSIQLDKFDIYKWLELLGTSFVCCFAFSIPWIVLKLLNCFCFGRLVCVLDSSGIHHENGFIKWHHITKIEYDVNLPGKYHFSSSSPCRAIVHTMQEKIYLDFAPIEILYYAKKYNSKTKTSLASGTKWLFILLIAGAILLVHLIPSLS